MVALRRKFESGYAAIRPVTHDLIGLLAPLKSLCKTVSDKVRLQSDHLGTAATCCFRMRVIVYVAGLAV